MLPVDRWYPAIELRHSTRIYSSKPVEEEKLAAIHHVCRTWSPSDCVRAVFKGSPGEEVFRGIIGGYGKIRGNAAYVAFAGKRSSPDVNEMIGYLGEAVILEATALGLATCWVGGFFRKDAVAGELHLAPDEHVFAVTPLGYPPERPDFEERLMRGFKTGRKRKPLASLVSGLPENRWPRWVRAGLDAARLAPSAVNRQPWRFFIDDSGVTLATDGKRDLFSVSRRLDCGIAMLHFELGALSVGVAVEKELLPHPGVVRFTH